MIAFVIPLRPKAQSSNWERDCALLQATIGSLLNQQGSAYNIYVVYSDRPEINIQSPQLHFVHFPFAYLPAASIEEGKEIMHLFKHDSLMFERRWDKSRKIFYGCKAAKEQGCSYIMSVDADDLISCRLVNYIEERIKEKNIPGFYIEQGYLYKPGKNRMIQFKKGMQNFNGSTHIVHESYLPIPDFEKGKWMDYNFFTSHGWIIQRLKDEYGVELEPVPFPAVIYISHGGNISGVGLLNFKDQIKNTLKIIFRGQRVNAALKKEFSIPSYK